MTRTRQLHQFVAHAGCDPAGLIPLPSDASRRRYLRLDGPSRRIVMDAPPDLGEDTRPFIAVTAWLRDQGLSAPEILASDPEAGFLLLEDLGDALFARHCQAEPDDEMGLYAAATDLLAHLSHIPAPEVLPTGHPLAAYDADILVREARLVMDWYLPVGGHVSSNDLCRTFDTLIGEATAIVARHNDTVVLRDYHAENLIWMPDRGSHARVGLLDYQDALAGHPAYDLVSLLEDARRDTAPALQEAMIQRFLDRTGLDAQAFCAAYAALGAQRNLKIIGIFARLCLRDGRAHYPQMIPRVWAHLQRDLAHPALVDLARFVADHIPTPTSAIVKRLTDAVGSRT